MEQIMFVGIDVAHDPLKKNASVLGLVANLNNECTKYFSVIRIMKVHQEISDGLQSAFSDLLDEFVAVCEVTSQSCNLNLAIYDDLKR
jgi:hypothetical protein